MNAALTMTLVTASLAGLAGSVVAGEEPKACFSEKELREAVAAKSVVPQIQAVRAAKSAASGDVVRARLCTFEAGAAYLITTLTRDGKVVQVRVDAVTGKPLSVQ
ncbi:MAG: PepSY domain-containing protein [Hyphomicrobiales bacterium]